MKIISNGRVSTRFLMPTGFVLLYLAIATSVVVGPMDISLSDSFQSILPSWLYDAPDLESHILLVIQEVRLPRTLLAVAVGAMLALCGAVMQGLFRNPLADPGIIGVSAGASLGAALAIVVFGGLAEAYPRLLFFGTVPLFAFFGGVTTTLIVYRLGTSQTSTSVTMMLLAGVALAALAGAGLGLLNYFADDEALRDLSLWTMGSLAGASWGGIGLAFSCLAALFYYLYKDADKLNALLLGEPEAKHMGVNVQALKIRLIMLTAAGVGITVSLAGMIGFIGLIVPHLGRMLSGPNHRSLLPLSMLLGALLLLVADILARTIKAPLDIPVGIITALIGSPFFIWLLVKQRGRL